MPDFFLVPNVWPHGVELEPAKNWWCLSHFIVFRKCWNHEILFNVWCQKVIKVIFRCFWAIVNTSKICWGLIKASEGLFNLKRKNTPNKDLEFDHAQDMPFHIGMLRCKDSDLGCFFLCQLTQPNLEYNTRTLNGSWVNLPAPVVGIFLWRFSLGYYDILVVAVNSSGGGVCLYELGSVQNLKTFWVGSSW